MTPTPHQPDIDKLMEQAQVFASSWSLVGSRLAASDQLEQAESEKAELRAMLSALLDRLERAEADAKHYSMGADAEARSADEWRERALRAEAAAGAVPEGIPLLTGYAMRHRTGSDIGFSWDKDDPQFGPMWERIPMIAAAPKAAPIQQAEAAPETSSTYIHRCERCNGLGHVETDTPAAAPSEPVATDRRRCKPCGSIRGGTHCWKCGAETFEPSPLAGDEPKLPPIDRIRELAREVGYAVGVHGSQQRDFDVIAAPWTEDAIGNGAFLQHIAAGLTTDNGPANIISSEHKPLGRFAATIQMDGWYKQLDISICPIATPPAQDAGTGEPVKINEPGHSDSLADRIFNLPCRWDGDPSMEGAVQLGHTMACEQAYKLVFSETSRAIANSGRT